MVVIYFLFSVVAITVLVIAGINLIKITQQTPIGSLSRNTKAP